MLGHAALVFAGRATPFGGHHTPNATAQADLLGAMMVLVAVALIGLGLAQPTGRIAWRATAVPAICVAGLLTLREASRGRHGRPWRVYLGTWMIGLTWPILVLWSVGLTTLH